MEKERKASKQNKGIFGALCIMLIMLLITGAGGYTYARYMSQEKGTGSADIANWAFEITKNGEETKTINLTSTATKSTLVNGKIAPGTAGEFIIALNAIGSEVSVDYKLEFANEKNKPDNIMFTYNGNNYKSLSEIDDITGTFGVNETKTKIIKISWVWLYQTGSTDSVIEANDKLDTQNGTAFLYYSFDIIATGTQSK